jgi:hypothetical protein
MLKKEKQWVDWFMDEFEAAARGSPRSSIEALLPWEKIEEKGVGLKIVRTDEPGWYDRLKARWQKLLPEKWCKEFLKSLSQGEPVRRPGSAPPTPRQIKQPWLDGFHFRF